MCPNPKLRGDRLLMSGVIALALLMADLPPGAGAAPAPQGARTRLFAETGQAVSGRFLDVWEQAGDYAASLYVNGFPLTDRRPEVNYTDGKTYPTQWFERARYEEHAEYPPPHDVLLGLLGAYAAEGRTEAPFTPVEPGAAGTWFPETRHTIRGAIARYWQRYGGVAQFGLPLSEEFQEESRDEPGRSYTVQYFERQRFEYHPEYAGTLYEVLLGRLGAEQVGQGAEAPRPVVVPGGVSADTVTVALRSEPDSLFSATSTLYGTQIVLAPVENRLVYRDDVGAWRGDLAYFVPTLENGGATYVGEGRDRRLVVKYKLKHGVRWSDGAEFTSADVGMWYQVVMDPVFWVPYRVATNKIARLTTPDAHTVLVHFLSANEAAERYRTDTSGYAYLKDFIDRGAPVIDPAYNRALGAYPQHLFKEFAGRLGDLRMSKYARYPVSTGPYLVKAWQPGMRITLEANPYYSVTPQKPFVKTIVFNIQANTSLLTEQFQRGEFDVVTEDSSSSLSQAADLEKLGEAIRVYYTPGLQWEHAAFNLERPLFQDVRVRQAIAYAINRQAIVDQVLLGKGLVPDSWLPPSDWASMMNPAMQNRYGAQYPLTKYPYNPDKARQLLNAAGWTVGADGIRSKEGVRLAFKWSTTANNRPREATVRLVKDHLAQVGIELTPEFVPAEDYFDQQGPFYQRQLDISHTSWASGDDPDGYSLFHSSQIPTEANNYTGVNIAGWRNARNDALLEQAARTVARPELERLYAEQQQLWSQEVPQLALYVRPQITAARAGLHNFRPTGATTPPTWNAHEWFLQR